MLEDARKIIDESGNNFQCKVLNYFRDNKWAVSVSPYYVDYSTEKAREVDLVVERDFKLQPRWANGIEKRIRLRLFVECKYIAHNVVFWFDTVDEASRGAFIESNTPFRLSNTFHQGHHYFNYGGRVAKMFATEKKNEDSDPIFRAINQCLNGFVNNRGRKFVLKDEDRVEYTTIEYPLIVCSDFKRFYQTEIADVRKEVSALDKNFQIEVNYAYVVNQLKISKREYFLVDFVSFDLLPEFISSMESEIKVAQVFVEDN